MARHLTYTPDLDAPASDYDEYVGDLVGAVTDYFHALGSGDADALTRSETGLKEAEIAYHDAYGNPRDVIDPEDPAVIAAHAKHLTALIFNPLADDVMVAFERTVDLDGDRLADQHQATREQEYNRRLLADRERAYRRAYPTAPHAALLARFRRSLTPRVIA